MQYDGKKCWKLKTHQGCNSIDHNFILVTERRKKYHLLKNGMVQLIIEYIVIVVKSKKIIRQDKEIAICETSFSGTR